MKNTWNTVIPNSFIYTDPIQIPKMFEEKEDIEISGFLAASLAWGQRPTIIKKCKELMQFLDFAPYDLFRQPPPRIWAVSSISSIVRSTVMIAATLWNHWLISIVIKAVWKLFSQQPGNNIRICSKYFVAGIKLLLPFLPKPGYYATSLA